MTVRGRRLLAEADVVIADRLGPTDVLAELDPEVQVIDVGKRPGHHPVPQEEINALLVEHARAGQAGGQAQGRRSVRLRPRRRRGRRVPRRGRARRGRAGPDQRGVGASGGRHPGDASRQRGIRACRQRPGRDVLVDHRGARATTPSPPWCSWVSPRSPGWWRPRSPRMSPATAPSRSSNAATRPSSAPRAPRSSHAVGGRRRGRSPQSRGDRHRRGRSRRPAAPRP